MYQEWSLKSFNAMKLRREPIAVQHLQQLCNEPYDNQSKSVVTVAPVVDVLSSELRSSHWLPGYAHLLMSRDREKSAAAADRIAPTQLHHTSSNETVELTITTSCASQRDTVQQRLPCTCMHTATGRPNCLTSVYT